MDANELIIGLLALLIGGGLMYAIRRQQNGHESDATTFKDLRTRVKVLEGELADLHQQAVIWQRDSEKLKTLQVAFDAMLASLWEVKQHNASLSHEMATLQATNERLKQRIETPSPTSRLRELIIRRLDAAEVRTLTADLGADYESLAGAGHAAKVQALLEWCERREVVDKLTVVLRQQRPDVLA